MNQAHWHLVLNHLPIIVPMIGLLVLIGGFVFRSETVKRTSFFIFILGALCTIPAFATGEGAEEIVENLAGVDEKLIKIHEEAAETFAILSYILGGLSLVGLWANWKQKSFSTFISVLIIALSLGTLFFAKQTGTTGGEIRHTEIRSGNAANLEGNTVKDKKDDD
jgi:uncharacterized membrane protein